MPWSEFAGPELGLAEGGGVEGCADVDVGGGAVGDEVGAGHDCGGGFVPEREAGFVGTQQGCVGAVGGGGDFVDGVLREVLLVGHVSGNGDGGEIGCYGDVGCFGVDDEVEIGTDVLGYGRLEAEKVEIHHAAHYDELFGCTCKGVVETDCCGNVGQSALGLSVERGQ